MSLQVPLPWERLLWSGRSALFHRPRRQYLLTDLRLVSLGDGHASEITLYDIHDIERTESRLDRITGTSTLVVHGRSGVALELIGIRRGPQLAAVLDLLSGESRSTLDARAVDAALAWEPERRPRGGGGFLAAVAVLLIAAVAAVVGLHGKTAPVLYAADDPLYPGGHKRPPADIVHFMERDVMPWARAALGPIKGGPDHVNCQTCHGADAVAREWRMPAVAALPEPDVQSEGWELYSSAMDAQMRNAIYGYLADSDKQAHAAYMREVVMPGMAHLLRRPAYDFTQPYAYNRANGAFGCYHCHRVK